MKIIGKNSLASAVYHLLWILLPLGILVLLATAVWVGLEMHELFGQPNPVVLPVLVVAGLLLSTAYLVDATYNPFLYFRF